MKTTADVAQLKIEWKRDPVWDIEDTEGFEEHRDELAAYHEKMRQEWAERRERDLLAKAEWLGVPGNTTLARRFEVLEYQIRELSERLDRQEA